MKADVAYHEINFVKQRRQYVLDNATNAAATIWREETLRKLGFVATMNRIRTNCALEFQARQ